VQSIRKPTVRLKRVLFQAVKFSPEFDYYFFVIFDL
jgi:hypothetical protein